MRSLPGVRDDIFITSTFNLGLRTPMSTDLRARLARLMLRGENSTHAFSLFLSWFDSLLEFASQYAIFNFVTFYCHFSTFLVLTGRRKDRDLSHFRIGFNEKRQAGTAP